MVHADSTDCASDETGVPAFEPISDNPNCLAGRRRRQRSSGDGNKEPRARTAGEGWPLSRPTR